MNIDPHTLQQILLRIRQQLRCPQCGKRVQMDFSNVKVVATGAMLLQLKCDGCNAYIVLHASLQGLDSVGVQETADELLSNVSSSLHESERELGEVSEALKSAGGSFQTLFKEDNCGKSGTDVA